MVEMISYGALVRRWFVAGGSAAGALDLLEAQIKSERPEDKQVTPAPDFPLTTARERCKHELHAEIPDSIYVRCILCGWIGHLESGMWGAPMLQWVADEPNKIESRG